MVHSSSASRSLLDGQSGFLRLKLADQDAQIQEGAVMANEAFGPVGGCLQKLDRAWGIHPVPQDVAAHLDQGAASGSKKRLPGNVTA
jgi:hypothetical protein